MFSCKRASLFSDFVELLLVPDCTYRITLPILGVWEHRCMYMYEGLDGGGSGIHCSLNILAYYSSHKKFGLFIKIRPIVH